ncbi:MULTISPECIES: M48 family metallopeptidase [Roseomonadaceae]|uniref:M48 family metallopeptidase n=1 Tax=Falsiroseomonas oleicola TaxID=2801474 RepID=A0ABS6H4W5_9PROT|nr:M48 family metallopeptidase [Roseomonas oleicola]MBU8543723.1 M48 family metallopeptidase [Roseomonas oleicola]
MAGRRVFCMGLGAMLCGCGGAVRPPPLPPTESVRLAAAEAAQDRVTPRRMLASGEASATVRRIAGRLNPPALEICREIGLNRCDWFFRTSRSTTLNAAAGSDGRVEINRGVLEYARNDDEVALVMAHELAHHAADHVRQGRANQQVGAAIGGTLMGALVIAGALAGGRNSAASNRRDIEGAGRLGGRLGRLSFSRDQEREADHLGALILFRAGYDLDKARSFLLTMARLSDRQESGMFDSHPAGPERIAAFDQTVAQLRATQGRIPVRPG